VVFSPDGSIFAQNVEHDVKLFNANSLNETEMIKLNNKVLSTCFSNDNKFFLVSDDKKSIHIWDLSVVPATCRAIYKASKSVSVVCVFPDNSAILTREMNNVGIWDFPPTVSQPEKAALNIGFTVDHGEVSPGNSVLVVGTSEKSKLFIPDYLHDWYSHSFVVQIPEVKQFSFSSDAALLAVNRFARGPRPDPNILHIFNTHTGSCVNQIKLGNYSLVFDFLPETHNLLCMMLVKDALLQVVNADTKEVVTIIDKYTNEDGLYLKIAPKGNIYISTLDNVIVLDKSFNKVTKLGHKRVLNVSFVDDLCFTFTSPSTYVWNTNTFQCICRIGQSYYCKFLSPRHLVYYSNSLGTFIGIFDIVTMKVIGFVSTYGQSVKLITTIPNKPSELIGICGDGSIINLELKYIC